MCLLILPLFLIKFNLSFLNLSGITPVSKDVFWVWVKSIWKHFITLTWVLVQCASHSIYHSTDCRYNTELDYTHYPVHLCNVNVQSSDELNMQRWVGTQGIHAECWSNGIQTRNLVVQNNQKLTQQRLLDRNLGVTPLFKSFMSVNSL